jgi:cytochrome c oxidase subunit 2
MTIRSSKTLRVLATLIGALGLSALLSACASNGDNFLDPSGPIALRESWLFWFILIVATIIFVAVTSVLMVSIFRFRSRPGGPEPRQLHGNTPIEIAWTVAPSIVLFLVLGGTILTMFSLGQPDGPAITVRAIGHQWWWEFQYPDNGGFVTADEMHIPVGQVIHIELRSNNVIHSFWVPSLAGKMDVIPGQNNAMWFKADRADTFHGECTEYCGLQHAHMNFTVVAQSASDYAAWVAQQNSPAATPTTSDQTAGQKLFNSEPCWTCHVISGQGKTPPTAPIGPNLTHFGSRQLIAGGVLTNTPENLKAWIHDTQAIKFGNDMPTFTQLSDQDLNSLVAYLENLQ